MGLWLLFLVLLIGTLVFIVNKFRQKEKLREKELKAKKLENIRLKEEFLKIKSGKEKLKDNLEKYRKENKSLQEVVKKKRKQRSDAGKRRDISNNNSGNKRTGKPKGAKGGGLKNPDPKEIDYTREWYLECCPECKKSLKNVKPFDHHNHYIRDFEKLKRGLQLVYIRHVIYRYKCPGCGKIVSKYFGKLKNARYGIGMIAFVLYERLERGGSWEGIRSTMNRIIHTIECVPTVATFIDWIRKYEDEMWEVYYAFLDAIGQSSFAHVDETGLPMDGKNWWLWVIVATEVVLYLPSKSRGSETVKDIFSEYKGILLSDFWSAYNKLNVTQQKCLQHLVRELRKICLTALDRRDKALKRLKNDDVLKTQENNEEAPKTKKRGRPARQLEPLTHDKREELEELIGQCDKSSRQLMTFYDFFKQAWKRDGNDMSVYTPIKKRISIAEAESRLNALIKEVKVEGPANADIERMIKRFEKYGPCLFTYLEHPSVMLDNNAVEREIRPFVVQRKISGNFISPEVMKIYSIHMSLYRTCKSNKVNYEEVIIPLLKGDTTEVLRLLGLIKLVLLNNFPTDLLDVKYKAAFMEKLGVKLHFDKNYNKLEINAENLFSDELNDYFLPIRTTYLLAAGLLKSCNIARIPYPEGCKIGNRKYDFHIMIWKKFGFSVKEKTNFIEIEGKFLKGAEINLPIKTIGGTENSILCASCVDDLSIIKNAYISPEVDNLMGMLKSMGVIINIKEDGTIKVIGNKNLRGTNYNVIPDRIEALTWIVYGIISKGDLLIKNIPFEYMKIPLIHLNNIGLDLYQNSKNVYINKSVYSTKYLQPFELACGTHPGIISDMQPFFTLLALKANGVSRIYDYRYPKRIQYLSELAKYCLNALKWQEGKIEIKGPSTFTAAESISTDLRGSMAVVLAGLISNGISVINGVEIALRGYNQLIEKLKKLGIKNLKLIQFNE